MAKKYKKFEKSEKSPLNNDYFVMEETTLPLSDYILTNWTEQSEYSGFEINHDNFEDVLLKINVNELKNTWFCGVCYESFDSKKEYRITPCRHVFHSECLYS